MMSTIVTKHLIISASFKIYRIWFSVVCTLIDNVYVSSQRSKCPQQSLTTVMTHIVVDKSTDNAKAHLIYFFTTVSTSKTLIVRAQAEKGIARH